MVYGREDNNVGRPGTAMEWVLRIVEVVMGRGKRDEVAGRWSVLRCCEGWNGL